jgi:deferrochelatase/peroxidase EfeB
LLGAPIAVTPWEDNKELGKDKTRNNAFVWNKPSQLECPFASHTRKTGPRNDLNDGVVPETFAIIRAGRPFALFTLRQTI